MWVLTKVEAALSIYSNVDIIDRSKKKNVSLTHNSEMKALVEEIDKKTYNPDIYFTSLILKHVDILQRRLISKAQYPPLGP